MNSPFIATHLIKPYDKGNSVTWWWIIVNIVVKYEPCYCSLMLNTGSWRFWSIIVVFFLGKLNLMVNNCYQYVCCCPKNLNHYWPLWTSRPSRSFIVVTSGCGFTWLIVIKIIGHVELWMVVNHMIAVDLNIGSYRSITVKSVMIQNGL